MLVAADLVAADLFAGRPAFVSQPLEPSFSSKILSLESLLSTDVVWLSGGLRDGLQAGMHCEVSRGNQVIGQIVIVEASSTRAAALITALEQHSTFKSGDLARVQTIKNG
jgi:hypothetical protein